MEVEDLPIIILGAMSVALAILVWLVQRRERLEEQYVDSDNW